MENVKEPDGRVRELMDEFGFTEAEALRVLAETGDGDIKADPPLTEDERRQLGLQRRSIADDPRFAFLKDRSATSTRQP
jgi:hypothetical protein